MLSALSASWWEYSYEGDLLPENNQPKLTPVFPDVQAGMILGEEVKNGVLVTEAWNGVSYYAISFLGSSMVWVPSSGLDNTLEIRLATPELEQDKPFVTGLALTGLGQQGDLYLPLHFASERVMVGNQWVELNMKDFQVIRVIYRQRERQCEVYFEAYPDMKLVIGENAFLASPRKNPGILYGHSHAPSFGGRAVLDYLRWTNTGAIGPDQLVLENKGPCLSEISYSHENHSMQSTHKDTAFPSDVPDLVKSDTNSQTGAYESQADLSDLDVARFNRLIEQYARFPLIAIPRLNDGVIVDGQLNEAVWELASQFRGLTNLHDYHIHEKGITVSFFHTAKGLYVGWRIERPEGALLRATGTGRSTQSIWNKEDGVELVFSPEENGRLIFSVYINATGKYAHSIIEGGSGFDVTTDIPLEVAAVTENGVTTGELFLKFSGVRKILEARNMQMREDRIGFNLMQVDTFPGIRQSDWSDMWSGQRYSDAYAGMLRLMPDSTAVRIEEYGRVGTDDVGFRGMFLNKMNSGVSLNAWMWEATRDVIQERLALTRSWDKITRIRTTGSDFDEGAEFQLLMGENSWLKTFGSAYRELLEISEKIPSNHSEWTQFEVIHPSEGGQFLVGAELVGEGDTGPIWQQTSQFVVKRMLELRLLKRFLTVGGIILELDAQSALDKYDGGVGASVEILLMDIKGNTIATDKVSLSPNQTKVELVIPMEAFPVGEYSVTAILSTLDGAVITKTTESFHKPEKPSWLGNAYGYTDEVPTPFSPVEASTEKVSMWGRSYEWSPNSPLPFKITSQGHSVLSSPMTLELTGSDTGEWQRRKWELKESVERHALYEGSFVNGPFTLTLQILVEFDGFMRFNGKLEGKGIIDALSLSVPVPASIATHYHASHKETDVRLATLAYTAGKVSDFQKHYPSGAAPWHGLMWIGGPHAGIQWIAEWDKGWINPDRNEVMEISEVSDSVILRASLIGKSIQLESPFMFDFAFNVSPVKDLQDSWHYHIITGASNSLYPKKFDPDQLRKDAAYVVSHGVDMTLDGGYGWPFHADIWIRDHNLPHWHEKSKILKEAGLKRLYYGCWAYSTDGDEAEDFAEDMIKLPRRPGGENTFWYDPEGPWVDFFMAGLVRAIEEFDCHSIYLDGMPVTPICADPYRGQTYLDEAGNLHGKWPFWALREWAHRMRNVLRITHSSDGFVYQHDSNVPNLAIVSLADLRCGGEETPGAYTVKEAYPLDAYFAAMDSRAFGIKYNTIWYNWWRRPLKENHMLSVILLHGQERFIDGGCYAPWQMEKLGYAPENRTSGRIAQLIRGEVVDAATADFHPYFREDNWVNPEAPVLASSMVHAGRSALVVLSNLETSSYSGEVNFDLELIGLDPESVDLWDAILDEPLALKNGILHVDIEPQRYRLLAFTSKTPADTATITRP